jgi:hypothetical protein
MALLDRIRRWWNPAQWEDDHPTERKQRAQPKKNALGSWFGGAEKVLNDDLHNLGPSGHTDYDRAFKKPR